MTNVNGKWQGRCAVCGEPVQGCADPRTDATVPAPERGEAAVCLLCLGLAKKRRFAHQGRVGGGLKGRKVE